MELNAAELFPLAADLACEHGEAARDYARRAVAAFDSEGETERARFWHVLGVFLDDIALRRLDPEGSIVLH